MLEDSLFRRHLLDDLREISTRHLSHKFNYIIDGT